MTQTRPSALAVAPSILEDLSNTTDGMDALSRLQGVFYGGAPLASSCGDKISSVTNLFNTIGSTEVLNIPCYMPLDKIDWEYFEFNPLSGTTLEEASGNLFELVIKQKFNREHQLVFHNFPDMFEWRTKDLFEQHAKRPGLWKYAGRIDDVIVLTNGEKFNPTSFEKIIEGHPWVQGALMVGQKRFQAGLMIEPRGDKTSVDSEILLREIWPLIERANEQYPTHARVWSSMVLVADPGKPFKRSPKGSVVRRTTCQLYEAEIASLYEYDTSTKTSASHAMMSSQDDANTVQSFVRGATQSVLGGISREIGQDENIFLLGMNSLQVLQLSRILNSRIHERHMSSGVCSPRSIYQNPTIKRLADAIIAALRNNDSADTNGNSPPMPSREERMSKMIYKHTKTLPKRSKNATQDAKAARGGRNIALTGSTGSLGSYLLHHLAAEPDVEHIFCLNRSADAEDRQKRSFNDRGMDWRSLRSQVHFLTVDLNQEHFGLEFEVYSMLTRSVDVFIHNAWPVNFNNDLEYFETAAITGMRRCVDFVAAADRHPHFVFISSIASVGNFPQVRAESQAIPEEFEEDNSLPLAQGYGESKHVASCILRRAARTSGVSGTIMRVGQLSGPEQGDGIWNKQEWLPSLIITSKNLGKIPRSLGTFDELDWVPVDRAAQAIAELTLSRIRKVGKPHDDDEVACFNVVNPRPAAWAEVLYAVQAFFEARGSPVESVSFSDWIDEVSKLQEGGQDDLDRYPAAKLTDFFREMERSAVKAKLIFATDQDNTQLQTAT
ncbi:putative secondary metabolism biosynthetic enzyme [Diaporthe australafricana]|uniref:Secondary metabolism biosynthetic enzyme n=1 Tax=Diaporthe australafricana TaxID=127596 RepID=A0ABR3WT92_9PEZI